MKKNFHFQINFEPGPSEEIPVRAAFFELNNGFMELTDGFEGTPTAIRSAIDKKLEEVLK